MHYEGPPELEPRLRRAYEANDFFSVTPRVEIGNWRMAHESTGITHEEYNEVISEAITDAKESTRGMHIAGMLADPKRRLRDVEELRWLSAVGNERGARILLHLMRLEELATEASFETYETTFLDRNNLRIHISPVTAAYGFATRNTFLEQAITYERVHAEMMVTDMFRARINAMRTEDDNALDIIYVLAKSYCIDELDEAVAQALANQNLDVPKVDVINVDELKRAYVSTVYGVNKLGARTIVKTAQECIDISYLVEIPATILFEEKIQQSKPTVVYA